MSALTKNGDGSYTISKQLTHILVAAFLATALGVVISIIAWWFGFAAFQAKVESDHILLQKHEEWFRSGDPSPIAKERFSVIIDRLNKVDNKLTKIEEHLNGKAR